MSVLRDTVILSEVKMNDTELLKPNASTGVARVDILLQKIAAGEPLELNNGQRIIIDKDNKDTKEFINVLKTHDEYKIRQFVKRGTKYPLVFVDDKGHGYPLNALKKADYFGGGTGSKTMSAEQTAWQESTQAMVVALALNLGRDLTLDDLTTENLVKAKDRYNTVSDASHAVDFISDRSPSGWGNSLINTANIIRQHTNKDMIIHHGSSWVKGLEKKFNEVNKDERGKIFPRKDKWNPADIWAVAGGVEVPAEINDLKELNAWLQKMYEEEKVIGFSLKKSPKGTKAKVFNKDDDLDDLLKITIKELLVSKTNKLFSGMDSYIMFEHSTSLRDVLFETDNAIRVRSFQTPEPIQAQISGRYAAGGKIGFGPLNFLLKQLGLPQLTHRNELKSLKEKDIANKIIKMVSNISPDIATTARENFDEIVSKLTFHQLATKHQAVQLISILKKAPEAKQRDFIQHVIQYASSRSDLSSVFIKVW